MSNEVSKSMAKFFMDQCMGETDGHMAAIPNNPVLFGICMAHEVGNTAKFAEFLRDVADKLETK